MLTLLQEILHVDTNKQLDIHFIFTGSQQKYDVRSFFLWQGLELLKKEKKELVSKYCGNIYWGRPDWKQMFLSKRRSMADIKDRVGVFACANYTMCKDIYVACQKYSGDGLIFEFNQENF